MREQVPAEHFKISQEQWDLVITWWIIIMDCKAHFNWPFHTYAFLCTQQNQIPRKKGIRPECRRRLHHPPLLFSFGHSSWKYVMLFRETQNYQVESQHAATELRLIGWPPHRLTSPELPSSWSSVYFPKRFQILLLEDAGNRLSISYHHRPTTLLPPFPDYGNSATKESIVINHQRQS